MPSLSDLTNEERTELELMIGYGIAEVGGVYEDDPVVRACRKLGLEPKGWHGEPKLPESDDRA